MYLRGFQTQKRSLCFVLPFRQSLRGRSSVGSPVAACQHACMPPFLMVSIDSGHQVCLVSRLSWAQAAVDLPETTSLGRTPHRLSWTCKRGSCARKRSQAQSTCGLPGDAESASRYLHGQPYGARWRDGIQEAAWLRGRTLKIRDSRFFCSHILQILACLPSQACLDGSLAALPV